MAAVQTQTQTYTAVCLLCRQERNAADFLLAPNGFTFSAFCRFCRQQHPEQVKRIQREFARGTQYVDAQRAAGFRSSALQAVVWPVLRELAKRRRVKRKEGITLAEDYAKKLARFPDRVAAIVSKTYAVRGDAALLADDEANMRIVDLCNELDETLIDRNKDKRLSPRA
jgi:hypothetical protein